MTERIRETLNREDKQRQKWQRSYGAAETPYTASSSEYGSRPPTGYSMASSRPGTGMTSYTQSSYNSNAPRPVSSNTKEKKLRQAKTDRSSSGSSRTTYGSRSTCVALFLTLWRLGCAGSSRESFWGH